MRMFRRGAIAAAAAAVAAVVAAPYWNLDRYSQRIQAILETELNRRVVVGKVRLDLWRGPGVSLSDVVIYDDPRAGREPLAYVTALEARVALGSLWSRRLEFASLRLVEPSVNLVKPAAGPWNFEELLSRALTPAAPRRSRLPSIGVRSGRINFKFGDVKSVLYLTDADLDITPPEGGRSDWSLRFSGNPARTDRPAYGLGRIAGRGRWQPGQRLELVLDLEKSYLEEVSALLAGRDLKLRGHLTARARVAGPLNALEITGKAQLRDFRRWDLMPPLGGNWDFSYRGRLNLPAQSLALEATPEGGLPVRLHLRLFDYLAEPRWALLATFHSFPLKLAPGVLRVAGFSAPETLALEGSAEGAIGYSPSGGLRGTLLATKVTLAMPGRPTVSCARASLTLDRDQIGFGPWVIKRPDRSTLTLEGTYSRARSVLSLRIGGERWPIAAEGFGPVPGLETVPILQACRGGFWSGELRREQTGGEPVRWSGAVRVENTELKAPGLAAPVQVAEARLRLTPDEAGFEQVHAAVGPVPFQADYVRSERARWPDRLRLEIRDLEVTELERLLAPALDRRRGLLARALRLGRAPAPDWLALRRAEAVFRVDSLRFAGAEVASEVRGRMLWDGLRVEISGITAQSGQAKLAGRFEADLRRAAPSYRLAGVIGPMDWSGGQWSAEGILETSGLGEELLANLRSEGSFVGYSVELTPETTFERIAGRFALRFVRGAPRLRIEDLEAVEGGEILRGECRSTADGRLNVELSNQVKQIRLAVALWPPRIERLERR